MPVKFLIGTLIFLSFSFSASALEFPAHFVIPPIEEVPNVNELIVGTYYPDENRIEVRNLDDVDTLVHEIGHSIMRDVEFPTCESYLTTYSRTSVDEDKAESFMFFYSHRQNFRVRAGFNKCLMSKYRAIYRVFYPKKM